MDSCREEGELEVTISKSKLEARGWQVGYTSRLVVPSDRNGLVWSGLGVKTRPDQLLT